MPSSSSSSVMDTSGFAQVGKFGTLSLLKNVSAKRLNLPAQGSGTTGSDVVVTSFGIDTEELTFGRDPSCSVRLYYPDVAVVHCKIMFEERKAFLAVIGESGLIVDGCEVFPNRRDGASPTMIPLQNDSEIEIRGKRFKFSYPPKEMRAVLFSTPTPKSNRKLRLSMIQSAEVFSPRPSNDPSENLRILQSPLKNQFKSPTKRSGLSQPPLNAYRQNSPTPQRHPEPDHDEDDDEEDEIVLVDGNQPRVVQEDRDLVILEDVEVAPPMPLVRVQQYQNLPPRTPPRRKSMGKNTLHRAVLIRSAQRAVIRAEEEEEEREVLETVVSELVDSDEDDDDYEPEGRDSQEDEYAHPPEQTQLSDEDVEMQEASDNESEGEDDLHQESGNGTNNKPLWRKSLERIWPFKGSEGNDQDEDEDNQEDEEEGDQPAPLPAIQTPARRTLGSFLTPQFKYPQQRGPGSNNLFNRNSPAPASGAGRFSLGGGEPRRVLVEQPWRVKDLVVPTSSEHGEPPASPGMGAPVPASPRRAQLSEEERKAIQERRRSALREPDNFFPGGIPGMSPTKQGPSTPFTSPMKPSIPFAPLGAGPSSPSKARRTSGDEEDLDTRSLLEKMKETVEGMKKRRSLAPATPVRETGAGIGLGLPPMGSVKKLNLPPAAPVASDEGRMEVEEEPEQVAPQRMEEEEEHEEEEQLEQRSNAAQETFSLLRPEARKSLAFPETPQLVETPPTPAKVTPDVTTAVESAPEPEENSGMELDSASESEVVEAPKSRGRSRLLRPTATTKPVSKGKSTLSVAEAKERSRSTSREPRRSVRSKTPQREEEEHEEEPEVPAPKPAATRRAKTDAVPGGSKRATKPKKTPEVVESDDSEPPLPPPRRGRKAVASTSSAGESSQPESGPTKRGGSKAAVKKEPTEESVRPTAAAKRAVRKTPATASASEQSDSVSEVPVPKRRTAAAKSTATTTTAAKKKATPKSRAAVAPQDVEDSVEEVEEVPAPTKKASAAAKGKKKADVVKEEDDDEPPLPQPKPARGKAAATTTKSIAGSSLKTPAVRATRSTKKTPSTAPAAMEGVDNKENEKAGGSGSGTNEEGVTKVKVSRSRAKAAPAAVGGSSKTVVKDEPVEEAPKTRVMRSRARTKTG